MSSNIQARRDVRGGSSPPVSARVAWESVASPDHFLPGPATATSRREVDRDVEQDLQDFSGLTRCFPVDHEKSCKSCLKTTSEMNIRVPIYVEEQKPEAAGVQ